VIHRQDPDDQTARLPADWSQHLRRVGELRVPFETDAERDLYRRVGRIAEHVTRKGRSTPDQTRPDRNRLPQSPPTWADRTSPQQAGTDRKAQTSGTLILQIMS
jgi:hypothetical protein